MSQIPPKMKPTTSELSEAYRFLRSDLPTFAKHCLKIRTKQGQITPFTFNKAQLYTHERLEQQRKKQGFVRAIILKARQLGLSTYVAARFFQKTALETGTSTFILAHHAKSTAALFDMVRRFTEYLPPDIAPPLDTANKNQLRFAKTSSEYTVGTAGSDDVGRGLTVRLLHGSEVAFYPPNDSIETGIFQAVADLPGTEVILESTAQGMTNLFYRMTMAALSGQGLYQVIFIPWFWEPQYALPIREGFTLTEKELEIQRTYALTDEQIMWRRKKIESYGGREFLFLQEYPSDPREAFLVSGESFYRKETLVQARNSKVRSPNAPVVMGIDCARVNDRSVFLIRQGRAVLHYEVHQDLRADEATPTQQLAAIAVRLIEKFTVHKVFIDAGYGYGLIDELVRLGYKRQVTAVQFGQQPLDQVRFLNKRAEMYGLSRDWLEEGNVSIPDTDEFMFDLLLTPMEKKSPSNRIFLTAKSEIKSKHGVSPDICDAFCLTFAFPVAAAITTSGSQRVKNISARSKAPSSLTTLNRIKQKTPTSLSVNVDF